MRSEPSWRITVGVLALLVLLLVYGIVVAQFVPPLIGQWHALAQLPVYIVLGSIWLLPMGRFLMWMETGHWQREKVSPSRLDTD
jgi:hypothetical protein